MKFSNTEIEFWYKSFKDQVYIESDTYFHIHKIKPSIITISKIQYDLLTDYAKQYEPDWSFPIWSETKCWPEYFLGMKVELENNNEL